MTPDDLIGVIRTRRSSLLIDPARDVTSDVVSQLCEAVQWAPNHKRNWPAQLAVIRGESRSALGAAIADVMREQGEDGQKVEKTRTKYLRAPVVIAAASAHGDSEQRMRENTYSVAAGIQNMLLLAHNIGLSCLWGSPATGANDAIVGLCQFTPQSQVLGLIYVGWPSSEPTPVERPPIRVTYLD